MNLAREKGYDAELMALALQSNQPGMIDAARYFERKQSFDKAIRLYFKAGNASKAIELGFKTQQIDVINEIGIG